MSDKGNKNITSSKGPGIWGSLTDYFKLVTRLMVDGRVNPFLKLLPIATLIYLVLPTDLLPLIPIDDALVIWLGTYMFVELCPPNVVEEHRAALRLSANEIWPSEGDESQGEVIDAEYWEEKENDS